MEDITKIYSRNLFFTTCVFIMGFVLPYIRENTISVSLWMILAVFLYGYVFKLLIDVVKNLNNKDASINELKFLFITLAVLCASGYFFVAITDAAQNSISGLRVIKAESEYDFNSFKGPIDYFIDIARTYLNSLYYSIVVMATIGDSTISVKGELPRVIIAFEVTTALTLTIFKIGKHYSKQSSHEAKATEDRIINEIKKVTNNYNHPATKSGFINIVESLKKSNYIKIDSE